MDEQYQPLSRRERRERERAQEVSQSRPDGQSISAPAPQGPGAPAPQGSGAPGYAWQGQGPSQPTPPTSGRPMVRPAESGVIPQQRQAPAWQPATEEAPRYEAGPPPTMPTSRVEAASPAPETRVATAVAVQDREEAGRDGEPSRGQQKRGRQKKELEPLGPVRATVRGFGEICITAGLVLVLFVVWQLWWTDIDANRDNEQLAQELTQNWGDPAEPPADPDTPVVADTPQIETAFGIVYIPRFGEDYYRTLAEGVSLEPVLNRMGLGRYPTSAMPGEEGNFALAGHRVTFGKPLNQIAELRPGDPIVVQTKDGFYTYTFRNYDIVLPDNIEVLSPVPSMPDFKGKDRIMTMTACNPMFSAQERYIAYAELTEWRPASEGPPEVIAESPAYSENGGGA